MSDDNVISMEKRLTPEERLITDWYWLGYWAFMGRLDHECCESIQELQKSIDTSGEDDKPPRSFEHFIRGADHARHDLSK